MATTRRDALLLIQGQAQQKWRDLKVFEEDAPDESSSTQDKFLVTFPYPYCNGFLHIGHSFSLSKAEFIVGYKRMKNIRCLFPFGFHCTGMPIQASANKLAKEISLYGNPPNFPNDDDLVVDGATPTSPESNTVAAPNGEKAKAKKGKVASKASKQKYQWEILKESGIDEAMIPEFADPLAWLRYFPLQNVRDLNDFGLKADWRRSFITTEVNPFYDSFIRWQFRKLRQHQKIKFGKRNAVFSPLDGQPCADHDRSSGEGVQPQEYTLIKMKVLRFPSNAQCWDPIRDRTVILPAATLRPETMYGQTNCWVLPTGDYGAFELSNGEVFIMSRHAARNMAFQDFFDSFGEYKEICPISGADLIGLPLEAPLARYEQIFVLPLLTVSMTKGTGIVTSVPSDAPDDFRGLMDLKEKEALRAKFGLQDDWVMPFEPLPIIETPGFGPLAAVEACKRHKIKSQNDKDALAKAKEEVYKAGFYQGTLLVGEMAGQSVMSAKTKIRDKMIADGLGRAYSEPEKKVMSRSGDECVVALCDQWYLEYGEEGWRGQVEACLSKMELYADETRNAFEAVLGWLKEWACSRQFGLGTKLPWDENWLIESLSDSTIYMAFYTVAHILQGGPDNLDGHTVGPAAIPPEQVTDAVWDFVLLGEGDPSQVGVDVSTLTKMRREFVYWYPVNLRVSGKDLIGNHLTFFLYNHVALFPEEKWPQGIRVNGHVLLNAEKMSKSTGNFLTLRDAIAKYTADGVRFALADAADTVEDANFSEKTADETILKLWTLVDFIEEAMENIDAMLCDNTDNGPTAPPSVLPRFADRVFKAQLDKQLRLTEQAYDRMMFRDAVKDGFFEMINSLGKYREAVGADKSTRSASTLGKMHRAVFLQFALFQTVCLAPICPHTAEHIWELIRPALAKYGTSAGSIDPNTVAAQSVMQVQWPESDEPDEAILDAADYLSETVSRIRVAILKPSKKKKGGGKNNTNGSTEKKGPTSVTLYVCNALPAWQEGVIKFLGDRFDEDAWTESKRKNPTNDALWWKFPSDTPKAIASALPPDQKKNKKLMPFVAMVRKQVETVGRDALNRALKFDETKTLTDNKDMLLAQLKVFGIEELVVGNSKDAGDKSSDAVPGSPCFLLS